MNNLTEIKNFLILELQKTETWRNDLFSSGIYLTLINAISSMIEKYVSYVDFLFTESTINATLTNNKNNILTFLGLRTFRKFGAIGDVLLSSQPFTSQEARYTGETIIIDKWHAFSDENKEYYVYASSQAKFLKNSIQKRLNFRSSSLPTINNLNSSEINLSIENHDLAKGNQIYIINSINYNGLHTVTNIVNENIISIQSTLFPETFTGEEIVYANYGFIPVKEGRVRNFYYVTEGILNEKFTIYSNNVDQNEIQIDIVDDDNNIIQNIPIVDDLFFVNDIDSFVCQVINSKDLQSVTVLFGDGLTSKNTEANQRIRARYAETGGSNKNITSTNVITVSVDPIQDITGSTVNNIYINNIIPILGGFNNERANTNIVETTRNINYGLNQIQTKESWIQAIESVSFVKTAYVWTYRDQIEINQISENISNTNLYNLIAITIDGEPLTDIQENQINETIINIRKEITDEILWHSVNKIGIKFNVQAYIKESSNFSEVSDSLENLLIEKYNSTEFKFLQDLYQSNYINQIDQLDSIIRHSTNVEYVEINIPNVAMDRNIIVAKAATDISLDQQIVLQDKSLKIYLRRKIDDVWQSPLLIAEQDPNSNALLATREYDISDGVVSNNIQYSYSLPDIINNAVPYLEENYNYRIGTNSVNYLEIVSGSVSSRIIPGMYAYIPGMNIEVMPKVQSKTNTEIRFNINFEFDDAAPTSPVVVKFFSTPEDIVDIDNNVTSSTILGIKNPLPGISNGYLIQLAYKTQDGNGERLNDLRLSNFNQILDYLPEFNNFDLSVE